MYQMAAAMEKRFLELGGKIHLNQTVDEILASAEGQSCHAKTEREGIVFKQVDGGMTFKAISNKYLLGEK
jgi:phytoene dehydrogenase-like protein